MAAKEINLFSSEKGERAFSECLRAIEEFGMEEHFKKGVLVGLSGGADSVFLLHFLAEYRRRFFDFQIVACHVNHMIRGEEANRDEKFSEELSESLGIEFLSFSIDVPALSRESGSGLEECARDARYLTFNSVLSERQDVGAIAVAHNADDNLETILLNLLRGAGSRGLAGIPPVRDNIVRPLIYLVKSDITELLLCEDIGYVTDSTNLENDYKRNAIRNNILPELRKISSNPEIMASRASDNLRCDDEYIMHVARDFLSTHKNILNSELLSLDRAVRRRVLKLMCEAKNTSLSTLNIRQIENLLVSDNFEYSLHGGFSFVSEFGFLSIKPINDIKNRDYRIAINYGENKIPEFSSAIILSGEKKIFTNVHKISISESLSSAIIEGELFIRPRLDGDSVFYGGMTHKIKKIFNDRKIPRTVRDLIPILCDDKGPLWVPGFGARDDGVKNQSPIFVTLVISDDENHGERFYHGREFSKIVKK